MRSVPSSCTALGPISRDPKHSWHGLPTTERRLARGDCSQRASAIQQQPRADRYCPGRRRSPSAQRHRQHLVLAPRATNAAKYGAFSVQSGRVRVEWRIDNGEVHLEWRERAGPSREAWVAVVLVAQDRRLSVRCAWSAAASLRMNSAHPHRPWSERICGVPSPRCCSGWNSVQRVTGLLSAPPIAVGRGSHDEGAR
jgi:hypothetical protein